MKASARVHYAWLLLPLLLLLVWGGDFVYLKGVGYSDLTIAHFPNLIFLRDSLLES